MSYIVSANRSAIPPLRTALLRNRDIWQLKTNKPVRTVVAQNRVSVCDARAEANYSAWASISQGRANHAVTCFGSHGCCLLRPKSGGVLTTQDACRTERGNVSTKNTAESFLGGSITFGLSEGSSNWPYPKQDVRPPPPLSRPYSTSRSHVAR